jgi:hypothetical protein
MRSYCTSTFCVSGRRETSEGSNQQAPGYPAIIPHFSKILASLASFSKNEDIPLSNHASAKL